MRRGWIWFTWLGLLLVSLASWALLLLAVAALVDAWQRWPVVRLATALGAAGLGLFFISDQIAELVARERERGPRAPRRRV